ncbi:MAG TPA: hypothetical protein VE860_11885 [Chthoniobacterales bacterium]|nr:hypothetical protein [Chthoniobacterales bacterium]
MLRVYALEIRVDRAKAVLEGVDADSITKILDGYLSRNITTKALHGPKLVGVRLWIPQNARKTDLDLKNLLLPAPDGHLFPLGRVASFDTVSGHPQTYDAFSVAEKRSPILKQGQLPEFWRGCFELWVIWDSLSERAVMWILAAPQANACDVLGLDFIHVRPERRHQLLFCARAPDTTR